MSIAQLTKETLIIQEFLERQTPGSFLSYFDIERGTGIKMNERGKSRMRSAARRGKIEYSVRPGKGIELSSAENGVAMVAGRFTRVDNAIKRAEKTQRNISTQFVEEMSRHDQLTMSRMTMVFGAIRAIADEFRLSGQRLRSPVKDTAADGPPVFRPIQF